MTKLRQKLQITVWRELFAGSNFCDFFSHPRQKQVAIKNYLKQFSRKHFLQSNASVNSSCAQPPQPLRRLLRSICLPCQSWGWGICKFCAARVLGTHAVSYQNVTTQRILLEKQADWPLCQARLTTEEVCKGMFSILCMYFFIAYQARIT